MGRRSLLSLKTLFLSALISLSPTAAQADISEEAAAIIAALKEQVEKAREYRLKDDFINKDYQGMVLGI